MPLVSSLDAPADVRAACRVGVWGAIATLFGIVASGPLAFVVLAAIHPQPPWRDAELFARSFHPVQTLPFFVGFFLVGGYVVLVASLFALSRPAERARAASALGFVSAFAALVFFNYVVQTTFVPSLARRYTPDSAPILATFSMSNPNSLGWAIEMWAYGLLGVATWLVAPVFQGSRVERVTARLFVANGVVSVATALGTGVDPGWTMTPAGLVGFLVWNVLVFVMSAFAIVALRRRAL
jgi:hypothetical protein